jgi:glycosyltransferase involved in cell wall biosynthesis
MRRLRVLTVTSYLGPGGTSGRILGMVQGLDRSRIDHRICLLYAPHPEIEAHFGTTLPLFANLDVPIETLGLSHPAPGKVLPPPSRLTHSVRSLGRAVTGLARMVRSRNIDVIDAHMAPSSVVAGLASAITRTPMVMTEYHIGDPAPIMLWPIMGRLALDLADAVVTDSRPVAEDLKSWMFRRKDKVRIIPNGITPPRARAPREELRKHFGIQDGDIVVTQVSTLRPHKGHRVLLDAARLVLDVAPNARFLIVGFPRGREREYLDDLLEQRRRLKIEDRVFIGPYPDEIGDVWSVTDIHAHATLSDSLPNAIIEGMSLGKPAVVTAVGGIPDLVLDGETGFVVPPNRPDAFATALLRLISDGSLAQRIGSAAKTRYENGFRAQDTARKLEQLFEEVAAS